MSFVKYFGKEFMKDVKRKLDQIILEVPEPIAYTAADRFTSPYHPLFLTLEERANVSPSLMGLICFLIQFVMHCSFVPKKTEPIDKKLHIKYHYWGHNPEKQSYRVFGYRTTSMAVTVGEILDAVSSHSVPDVVFTRADCDIAPNLKQRFEHAHSTCENLISQSLANKYLFCCEQ